MDSKERIDRLTDQLKEAGYRYYVLDDPTGLPSSFRFLPR